MSIPRSRCSSGRADDEPVGVVEVAGEEVGDAARRVRRVRPALERDDLEVGVAAQRLARGRHACGVPADDRQPLGHERQKLPAPTALPNVGLPAEHGVEPVLARGDRGLVDVAVVVGKDEPDLAIVALVLPALSSSTSYWSMGGVCMVAMLTHSPLRFRGARTGLPRIAVVNTSRFVTSSHARVARGRDHRAAHRRGGPRRGRRIDDGARHQRAEDVRSAAARARRAGAGGRAPDRQEPRHRRRRRPARARAPHERGAPAALRQARVAARPHVAAAHPPGRRARAAPARVRDQAGGVGEAAALRGPHGRRGGREARARGVARPAGGPARGAERRRGRCTACCATSA